MDWGLERAIAECGPAMPAGFEARVLSCAWCGDRSDRIDLASDPPQWKVRDWFAKHKDCEERSRPPPRITIAVVLALAIALLVGCGSHGVAFPSAPGVPVLWQGTAIAPWPGLEEAIDAGIDVLALTYPAHPELASWYLEIWGPNDLMYEPHQITSDPYLDTDGYLHTLLGTTDRECGPLGLSCSYVVRVRQLLDRPVIPDPSQPHLVRFEGSLRPAGESGLFDELSCRLPAEEIDGWIGAYDAACLAVRAQMVARYTALRASEP